MTFRLTHSWVKSRCSNLSLTPIAPFTYHSTELNKLTNLLRQFLSLLCGYGFLLHVIQLGNGLGIIPKINLKDIKDISSEQSRGNEKRLTCLIAQHKSSQTLTNMRQGAGLSNRGCLMSCHVGQHYFLQSYFTANHNDKPSAQLIPILAINHYNKRRQLHNL